MIDESKVPDPQQGVQITGISIPFSNLVFFLVKLVLAAIPALIILSIFAFIVAGMIGVMTGGGGANH